MTGSLRILVIDSDPERAALVREGLNDSGGDVAVTIAETTRNLLVTLRQMNPDVLIVALDSPDRDVIEQLRTAGRETPRPVVMFVDRSDESMMRDAVNAGVSAYVVDGLAPKRVRAVLDLAVARFHAFEDLRRELDEARTSLADRKAVDRAKGILMERRGLSEDDAYKALRKMAMDQGRKIGDAARAVISVADVL